MPQKDVVREELLYAGILGGKSPARAARDAGFSESYARVNVYKWLAKDSTKQRLRTAVREIEIDGEQALRTLDFQMRGDIADVLPDNEILKAAQEKGVSKLIKKIRQRERFIPQGEGKEPIREVHTEIELYSAQRSATHLSSLLVGSKDERTPMGESLLTEADRRLRLSELLVRLAARQQGAINAEFKVLAPQGNGS